MFTKTFRAFPGHYKNFPCCLAPNRKFLWGPGCVWELSMLSQVLTGTCCAVLGLVENFLYNPVSLWELCMQSQALQDHSVQLWVLRRTFHMVLGPYRNFLCAPRSSREISVQSRVVTGSFHEVLGPYGTYCAVPGLCGNFPCSLRSDVPTWFSTTASEMVESVASHPSALSEEVLPIKVGNRFLLKFYAHGSQK